MRIYLTGATGYLGSNLVKVLGLKESVEELRLLIQNEERKNLLFEQLGILSRDCGEGKELKRKITIQYGSLPDVNFDLKGIDCVIHAAALRGIEKCEKRVKEAIDINIIGTKRLIDSIKKNGSKKTVFVSSQSVYLGNDDVPWKENAKPMPTELYAATKYAGELLVKELAAVELAYTILRPSRLFGLGLNMREEEVVVKFAIKILNLSPILVYGDGKNNLDIVHISDVIDFMITLLQAPVNAAWNQTYNLGRGHPITVYDFACLYNKAAIELNLPPTEIKFAKPEHRAMVPMLGLDITKAKTLLKWQPKVSLKEGIKEIIAWCSTKYNN